MLLFYNYQSVFLIKLSCHFKASNRKMISIEPGLQKMRILDQQCTAEKLSKDLIFCIQANNDVKGKQLKWQIQ